MNEYEFKINLQRLATIKASSLHTALYRLGVSIEHKGIETRDLKIQLLRTWKITTRKTQ